VFLDAGKGEERVEELVAPHFEEFLSKQAARVAPGGRGLRPPARLHRNLFIKFNIHHPGSLSCFLLFLFFI